MEMLKYSNTDVVIKNNSRLLSLDFYHIFIGGELMYQVEFFVDHCYFVLKSMYDDSVAKFTLNNDKRPFWGGNKEYELARIEICDSVVSDVYLRKQKSTINCYQNGINIASYKGNKLCINSLKPIGILDATFRNGEMYAILNKENNNKNNDDISISLCVLSYLFDCLVSS